MGARARPTSWTMLAMVALALLLWLLDEIPSPDAPAARADYEVLEGRWVDHRHNDGDSFRLELPDGRVEEFRLYFVDAPESAFKTYGGGRTNRERIADQAKDLGVTSEQAVEIGATAKEFVADLLGDRPVTLFTRWDDPFGDRRFHAFIEAPHGELRWLHERLVAAGLARIHTKGAEVPSGRGKTAQKRFLMELENKARASEEGVWKRWAKN